MRTSTLSPEPSQMSNNVLWFNLLPKALGVEVNDEFKALLSNDIWNTS